MSDHHYEEEQLAAIKNWWQSSGKKLLLIGIATVICFWAYQYYQQSRTTRAETASAYYDAMVLNVDRKKIDEAKAQAINIIDNYSGTVYSDMAAMVMARIAVEANDYAEAEKHYDWIFNNGKSRITIDLAKLNRAKLFLHQGELQKALTWLKSNEDSVYAQQSTILMADISQQLGDKNAAKEYYQKALETMTEETEGYSLIKMKLENVDVVVTELSEKNQTQE